MLWSIFVTCMLTVYLFIFSFEKSSWNKHLYISCNCFWILHFYMLLCFCGLRSFFFLFSFAAIFISVVLVCFLARVIFFSHIVIAYLLRRLLNIFFLYTLIRWVTIFPIVFESVRFLKHELHIVSLDKTHTFFCQHSKTWW